MSDLDFKLVIDDKNLKRGFVDFAKANSIATRNTLDTLAALTRKNAVKNIKDDFTLRNTFTVRNIQFQKVETDVIDNMESRIGATQKAKYMENQELGGRRKRRGRATAIPQTTTRIGGSFGKSVSKEFYIKKISRNIIRGKHKRRFPTHRAASVSQMFEAFKLKKFVKRGNNIFWVKSITKTGRNKVRARTERLYYIEQSNIMLDKRPWLEPALKKPVRDGPNIHKSQIKKLFKEAII